MKKTQFLLIPLILLSFNCSNNNDGSFIEASGVIEANSVLLSAKSVGEISSICFEEGSKIKAGDTLLVIDSENLRYQLKQTEGGTLIAQSQLSLLQNGARKEDIIQAEMMLKQTEVAFEQAKRDFERMDNLFRTNSITKKQLDDANDRLSIASSQFNSANENLKKLKHLARPEEIKQAEGRLQQTLASEELLKKSIRDCYITSPINGFITKMFVRKGETVSMMSSIAKVVDLRVVDLTIYVSESELGLVKLGQTAKIKNDTYPEKEYNGKIIYISPEAEFTPKNIQTKDERTKLVFAVKLRVDNPDFDLKVGMPADAKIIISNGN